MLIECLCGCGEKRDNVDSWGKTRLYIKGHCSRTKKYFERSRLILCKCGCGNKLYAVDNNGRNIRFIHGHNAKGFNNPKYNGGRNISKDGYIELLMPWHPNSRKNGYIFEHTFIMSRHLKRPLNKGEVIHHINGIKDDNRIENLELLYNQNKHMSIHFKKDLSGRKCVVCKSDKTRIGKNGYINWFIKDNGYQCNKCYMKEYHRRKKEH